MRIGIIGSGNVGGTLGSRWAQAGHEVAFSSREPQSEKMKELVAKAGPTARAATPDAAAQTSDVVVLSIPWNAAKEAIESLGDISGKVIIDAINPLLPDLSGLQLGTTTSAAEQVAAWAPRARVVKCFNSVGFNIMANPAFGAEKAVMFYCGDDASAKQTVKQLTEELGFDAVDAGPLRQARVLEPFAMLWISLAFGGHGREIAFRLLRR
jgi:hypothetical protein